MISPAMPLIANAIGNVLQPYWWIATVAWIVSYAATPVVRWLALRWKLQDKPDGHLKTHKQPIAYLGGVAVFCGWAAGLAVALIPLAQRAQTNPEMDYGRAVMMVVGLIAGGLVAMLTGLLDDVKNIKPKYKMLGQLLAAVILLVFGIGHNFAAALLQPLTYFGIQIPDWLIFALSLPLACFVVIAATNAANLLDGLDGLCTGVTGVITLGFFVFALRHAAFNHIPTIDPVRMVLALSMLGAVLGFLPFNFNPASIFLGDAGSVLMGFFAAAMMLLFTEEGQMRWLICCLLIFGLPIYDTSLAFIRRMVNHKPIFAGDRSHFYDQLVDRKFSVIQAVMTSYGLAVVFVVLGLVLSFVQTRYALPIFLGIVLLAALISLRLGLVRRDRA